MSNCKLNLEMFMKHKENVEKKQKLYEQRQEIADITLKKACLPVLEGLESLKTILESICKCEEKINSEKTATLKKFEEEFEKKNDEHNVAIPQVNHQDFQNIIHNKKEIENLIANLREKDSEEISEFADTLSFHMSNVKNKELLKDIEAFRAMEGLYNNIMDLKNIKDKTDTTLERSSNESDIGCYPHENWSDNSDNVHCSTPCNIQLSFSER